nr:hypothetical protein [Pseudomonas aeruginosa]
MTSLIEGEASQLVAFAQTVLGAAQQGLQAAVEKSGVEPDEARWDFNVLAEDHLRAVAVH